MIDLNKKYKTRQGQEYIPYWVGLEDAHGAVVREDGSRIVMRHLNTGRYLSSETDHYHDLIEVKEKKQLTGFVNVYKDGRTGVSHPYKEKADNSNLNRIACIDLSQYEIFYEENEGL